MSRKAVYTVLGLALLAAELLKPRREGARGVMQSPDRPANSGFRGALLGAALAFVAGVLTNVWSNYLTRRDQHVQQAETCRSLTSSLLSTISFANQTADAAASSIAAPLLENRTTNKFVLSPLDEMLHSQDQFLGILDPASREHVLRVEAYYRAIRDDLSNTPGIYHSGETFGVPDSAKDTYEGLLKLLAQQAAMAMQALRTSAVDHCNGLATTGIFWPP